MVVTPGIGYCWHLVDRDEGCCSAYNTQDSSSQQRIIWSKMLVVSRLRNPVLGNIGEKGLCYDASETQSAKSKRWENQCGTQGDCKEKREIRREGKRKRKRKKSRPGRLRKKWEKKKCTSYGCRQQLEL